MTGVMGHERHTMPDGTCRYPCIIGINRLAIPFPLRDKPPVASGDFMFIRNNDEISHGRFKCLTFLCTSVGFLRAIIQLAYSDE